MMVDCQNPSHKRDSWRIFNIGTGLVDGYPPGGIDGKDVGFVCHASNAFSHNFRHSNSSKRYHTMPWPSESKYTTFFMRSEQFWLCLFSHELYVYNITLDMCDSDYNVKSCMTHWLFLQCRHRNFAPRYNGRYLSSNVNITYVDDNGKVMDTPIGCMTVYFLPHDICWAAIIARFTKFKTKKSVMATFICAMRPWLYVSEEEMSRLLAFFSTLQETLGTPQYRRWKTWWRKLGYVLACIVHTKLSFLPVFRSHPRRTWLFPSTRVRLFNQCNSPTSSSVGTCQFPVTNVNINWFKPFDL
jgi:hypothetical protein